jgi:hypothetical protein
LEMGVGLQAMVWTSFKGAKILQKEAYNLAKAAEQKSQKIALKVINQKEKF